MTDEINIKEELNEEVDSVEEEMEETVVEDENLLTLPMIPLRNEENSLIHYHRFF